MFILGHISSCTHTGLFPRASAPNIKANSLFFPSLPHHPDRVEKQVRINQHSLSHHLHAPPPPPPALLSFSSSHLSSYFRAVRHAPLRLLTPRCVTRQQLVSIKTCLFLFSPLSHLDNSSQIWASELAFQIRALESEFTFVRRAIDFPAKLSSKRTGANSYLAVLVAVWPKSNKHTYLSQLDFRQVIRIDFCVMIDILLLNFIFTAIIYIIFFITLWLKTSVKYI